MLHCLVVLYQFCSNEGPRVQDGFWPGVVGSSHRYMYTRAREIVGFAGSGPIIETENRFISQQEAKKSVHKTLYFSRFCNTQTDIVTCQNCSHPIIRCYLS